MSPIIWEKMDLESIMLNKIKARHSKTNRHSVSHGNKREEETSPREENEDQT